MPRHSRFRIFAHLLLILLAAAAIWHFWPRSGGVGPAAGIESRPPESERQKPLAQCGPTEGVSPAPVTEGPTTPRDVPKSMPAPADHELTPAETQKPGRLRFVDLKGSVQDGLECRILPMTLERAGEGLAKTTRQVVVAQGQSVMTDAEGRLARQAGDVPQLVVIEEDRWKIVNPGNHVEATALNLGEGVILMPLTGERTVRVYDGIGVPIRIMWADGMPYTGVTTWIQRTGDNDTRIAHGEISMSEGYGLVSDIAVGTRLACSLPGLHRKGFVTRAGATVVVESGTVVEFTIPYSEIPLYGLELDFEALATGDSVTIEVQSQWGYRIAKGTHVGPGIWQSPGHRFPAERVNVMVNGATVWHSAEVNIADAENWPRLVVPKQSSIELRLRIVDEHDNPLRDAVVARDAKLPPLPLGAGVWRGKAIEVGDRAMPDAEGYVKFKGLPAGKHRVRVAAQRRYSRVVEFDCDQGQTVDLGAIRLEPIPIEKNRVVVTIIGVDDLTGLSCQINYTGETMFRKSQQFSADGRVEFLQVDYGDYQVYVFQKAPKSRRWVQRILITEENSEYQLTAQFDESAD